MKKAKSSSSSSSSSSLRSSILDMVNDLREEENERKQILSSSASSFTKISKLSSLPSLLLSSSSSSTTTTTKYNNEGLQVEVGHPNNENYISKQKSNLISKSSLLSTIQSPLQSTSIHLTSILKSNEPKLIPYDPQSSSSKSSSDPHSTPARRRRIIADVSKFLLKQYCVKACEHVHRFR